MYQKLVTDCTFKGFAFFALRKCVRSLASKNIVVFVNKNSPYAMKNV